MGVSGFWPVQADRLIFCSPSSSTKAMNGSVGSTGPGVTSCFHRRLLGEQKHCSGGATWGEQLRYHSLFPPSKPVATAQKGRCYLLYSQGTEGKRIPELIQRMSREGKQAGGKKRSKSVTVSTAVCWIPVSWPPFLISGLCRSPYCEQYGRTSPPATKLKVHETWALLLHVSIWSP